MTYDRLDTVVLETRRSFTMDPITTVGFASSSLTFIDFSQRLISGTFEVIKSESTSENVHVSVVINDLRDATKELSNHPLGLSKHEHALQTLASECQELSEDLQKLLNKLMVTAESSKWKSAKIALRSMWKKEEVAELQNRLDKYRSQILLRLVLILNYIITNPSSISLTVTNDNISERQLLVQIQLSTLQSESQKNGRGAVEQLTSLRNQVLGAVEKTINKNKKLESPQEQSEQLQLIKEVRATMDTLLESSAPPTPEMRILKQVYFRSIYSREDAMEKAHSGTFEWILKEELTMRGQDSDSEETEDEESEEDEGIEEDEESEEDADSEMEWEYLGEGIKLIRSQIRSTFLSCCGLGVMFSISQEKPVLGSQP
jgi:N-terminal domain on NACHT_NTPase and P-loop NTPases